MKKCWIILSIPIGMYGCSLLKKNSTSSSNSSTHNEELLELHELSERDSVAAVLTMHYQKDSVQEAYTVQLWPKGKFSFSAEGGFVGEAERILITGNKHQLLESGGLLNSATHTNENKKTDLDLQKKVSVVKKDKLKTSTPDYRVIIGIMVLLILAWRWLRAVQNR